MAVSFVSNALGGTTTTTTFSITLPATQAGDLIILEYTHRGTTDATLGGTFTGGGFTEKHDQQYATSTFSGKTLWTRATGDHSGQTVTGSGLTNSCAAIITVYRGAIPVGDPLADATIVGEQNASANETQAAITTTTNGAWVVLVVANSPDVAVTSPACTSPGALTGRAEVLSTGGTDTSIAHASAEKATAGATGAFTWAQTDGASGSWAYAIKPAVAAFTQAEAAFYDDGTESGSSVIDSGADSVTADVSGGDVNIQLRVRVQETAKVGGASTDDYQLQYEKNDSGVYRSVGTTTPETVDSYDLANENATQQVNSFNPRYGQSFVGTGVPIGSVGFNVRKVGSPTGNVTAYLYAHTGTFGTSSRPTGAALATSDSFDISTLTTSAELKVLPFSSPYTPTNGTHYVVAIEYTGGTTGTSLVVGWDNSSPTHAGNSAIYNTSDGFWSANSNDLVFYLYSTPPVLGFDSASLTDGNATTNRLGSGNVMSFVSQAAVEANTFGGSFPSHAAGDLLVVFAHRDGSTTSPTAPTQNGWVSFANNAGTTSSTNVSYKIAQSASEVTSDVWTNATTLTMHVYRNPSFTAIPIINSAGAAGTAASVDYSGIGAMTEAGTSWVARFAGHVNADTSLQTAPSGHTNRSNIVAASAEAAGHDTNGAVSSSSFGQVAVGGTAGAWITKTLELLSSKFVAGEISEDGLVDDLNITAGNFTELLYSLTIESTAVADADTLDFRVLRNGATTGMTYTVTPRITIEAAAGDAHTLVTQDIALALSMDATTITQNHVIQPQDIALSLSEDNTTISQNHVVATQDIALALTEDNATIAQNHVLLTQDIALALTEDNTTVAETNFSLTVQDVALALTEDNTTISQNHIVASNDIDLALTTDNTTVTQNHVLTAQDVALSLTEDNTTVTETNFVLASQDIALALSEDNATITQNHLLTAQDVALSLTEDATTITQNHDLTAQDIALSLTEDNTTLTQTNFVLTAQDIALALSEDNTTISQNHLLTAQDVLLSLTEDSTTLTQDHIVVSQDIALGLSLDNTTVQEEGETIIQTQDITLALTEDNTTLTQLHSLSTQDIALALATDNTTITQNHIVTAQDLALALTTDNATLTQNHIVVVGDIALALTTDNTTITQVHVLTPQDVALALSEDTTTLTQVHVLSPEDILLALSLDNGIIIPPGGVGQAFENLLLLGVG